MKIEMEIRANLELEQRSRAFVSLKASTFWVKKQSINQSTPIQPLPLSLF